MKSDSSNEFLGSLSDEPEGENGENVYEETVVSTYQRDELVTIAPERRPGEGLADVHMHTTYSDGTGSVEDVLTFAET